MRSRIQDSRPKLDKAPVGVGTEGVFKLIETYCRLINASNLQADPGGASSTHFATFFRMCWTEFSAKGSVANEAADHENEQISQIVNEQINLRDLNLTLRLLPLTQNYYIIAYSLSLQSAPALPRRGNIQPWQECLSRQCWDFYCSGRP